MTNPQWKLEWATDCTSLYTDETGVYDPELAVLEEYETERGTTRYKVYRVALERYKIAALTADHPLYPADEDTERYMVPCAWTSTPGKPQDPQWQHPIHYKPWFYNDLDKIAESCDHTSIHEDLCSEDPSCLAHAYEAIAGYHGWSGFDSYPQDLAPSAVKNWPDLDGKPEVTISVSNDDDGNVTLYCDDVEAARGAQNVLGSRWETPGGMATAYASVSDRADLVEALEAEGYEVDASEWSPPDDQDFAYWSAKYERSNGATPERLREILGWRIPSDVGNQIRRLESQMHVWWTGADRDAFLAACFAAGYVLDGEKWHDEFTPTPTVTPAAIEREIGPR